MNNSRFKQWVSYIILVVVCVYAGALLAYIGLQSAYIDKLESKLKEYHEREIMILNETKDLLDTYILHYNNLNPCTEDSGNRVWKTKNIP